MGLNNDRRVSARINGKDRGVWDTRSGGKTDSTSKEYHPGGGRGVPAIDLGGRQEHEPVTCGRWFDVPALQPDLKELRRLAGRQVPVEVTELDLDPEGNVIGQGETFIGKLKAAWRSDADSENTDEGRIEFEMTVQSIL
jgi:hypothetical protein